MLANQGLLVQTMHNDHTNLVNLLGLVDKMCAKLSLTDIQQEAQVMKEYLKETESVFKTLQDASTGDLQQILGEVKKYASETVTVESLELKDTLKKQGDASIQDLNTRFQKLEDRVLNDLADAGAGDGGGGGRGAGRALGDGQVMKKVSSRIGDFEAQVTSTLQNMQADVDKKLAFMSGSMQPKAMDGSSAPAGLDTVSREVDTLKYDIGELKDLLTGAKNDTAHVKRIVLACERDMEDFTAAMDAVNVDLDEMRARVDSTHSIITSRQRVEATVTAEISTMRLDMGDMQEALKAHDAWMEDVSQSLQECHERTQHLAQDIVDLRDQTQAKLDGKVDIVAWNDMNDDIDASIKTVRDMVSTLRLEVDSRRRKVDEHLENIRLSVKTLDVKVDSEANDIRKSTQDEHQSLHRKKQDLASLIDELDSMHKELAAGQKAMDAKMETIGASLDNRVSTLDKELRKQDEELHKEVNERLDGVERHHATAAKETAKRLTALDLRISGLQGASGEQKRDINKLRDEVNNLTVKSAAHDVDIGRCGDDLKRLERGRTEDNQRHKQDMDAVYEELDQKVYEKNFLGLEDNTSKLARGCVKIAQVLGVFPGARMEDGTEEELDIDVELLNWEDCCQNMVPRVEKAWRQLSSQKYKSVLDLVSKKADHSVLRLLQISQQHIESQLDRVRHERELWKEVVDKRAQQPLQLALTLKDQNTGMPLGGPMGGMGMTAPSDPRMLGPGPSQGQLGPLDMPGGGPKTPLAKRIQQKGPGKV